MVKQLLHKQLHGPPEVDTYFLEFLVIRICPVNLSSVFFSNVL